MSIPKLRSCIVAVLVAIGLLVHLGAPASAQRVGMQRYTFWGVLATNLGSRQPQWVPFGLYSNSRSAARALNMLRRQGLHGRIVVGVASTSELAQHAVTAERGRRRLLDMVSEDRLEEAQEAFRLVGGFDNSQRATIEQGGFSPERRATVNGAGFSPERRNQINYGRYPVSPAVVPNNRSFGTQAAQASRNRGGGFGTQGNSTTRNRGGGFGTQ